MQTDIMRARRIDITSPIVSSLFLEATPVAIKDLD